MVIGHKRYSEATSQPEITAYKMKGGVEYDKKVKPLVEQTQAIVARIQTGSEQQSNGSWLRVAPIDPKDGADLFDLKSHVREIHTLGGRGNKNILTGSDKKDTTIGHGKDSRVSTMAGKKDVVYKESTQEAGPEEILYLRRKYKILKTYLGAVIPQSRFFLGEVNHGTQVTKGMNNVDIPQMSALTLQRKIEGINLQKMHKSEKQSPVLLTALSKEHKKYILLKMFVQMISEEQGLPRDTVDVKMDLGPLSDIDQLDTQDAISVRKNLTSPNIMFDGKNVHFVDMDFGKWNEDKQKVFEVLMNPETIQRWDEILGNMGLVERSL